MSGGDCLYIRQERPADRDTVYQVILSAFAGADHRDGSEQDLAVALRRSEAFVPELSLVAVEDGRIVGHILFTEASVNGTRVLALAPLSVLPEYQNRGIGLALIRRGHEIAARLGYGYSVVLGHAAYYPRAGYVPASRYGIRAPFAVEDANFMAARLREDAKRLDGLMEYDRAFGI